MLENIAGGLANILTSPMNILYLMVGLAVGIIVGAIPGLTGMLAITICLPMTFGMEPIGGMLVLLGIYVGGSYGGSIPAVLINTPGAPAAAATVLDGYPAARRGYAKKALHMALYASCLGGIVSAVLLLFLSPQLAKVALRFGAAEYFSLSLFGISIISSLNGKSLCKGIISGALGVLVGCIGIDNMGVARFTFGMTRMMGGISTVVALIGLFAVAEVFLNRKMQGSVSQNADRRSLKEEKGLSAREFAASWRALVCGCVTGGIVGAAPGTGGGIAAFISYFNAKRLSKHPEEFGNGSLEGIAAAESANNGTTGTALIPMLTLGIPGDASTAIMMSALTVHNINPGPNLFTNQAPVVYTIIIGFLIINILLLFFGRAAIGCFEKITRISYSLLAPVIIGLCVAGAFAANNSVFNVYVVIAIGIVAFGMEKLEIPRAPMLLGIVLSGTIEKNFVRAMTISGGSPAIFFTRPISLAFLVLSVVSFLFPIIRSAVSKK